MQHVSNKMKRQREHVWPKGTFVVSSPPQRVYQLEDLLKRITPHNVHEEADFGGPVGREAG